MQVRSNDRDVKHCLYCHYTATYERVDFVVFELRFIGEKIISALKTFYYEEMKYVECVIKQTVTTIVNNYRESYTMGQNIRLSILFHKYSQNSSDVFAQFKKVSNIVFQEKFSPPPPPSTTLHMNSESTDYRPIPWVSQHLIPRSPCRTILCFSHIITTSPYSSVMHNLIQRDLMQI